MKKFASISEVADYHGCTGCGACSYADPSVSMKDDHGNGLRPTSEGSGSSVLAVCPGAELDRSSLIASDSDAEMDPMWGPVLAVYEGYASDNSVRSSGSSGGMITALSQYALDSGTTEGVLHTVGNPTDPSITTPKLSRSTEEVLAASGSRYAVSSPLSGLASALDQVDSLLFVGKPCDAAGLHKISQQDEKARRRVALSLSFFCAGTPSTSGNKQYIEKQLGGKPEQLHSLKYRGEGWPGLWEASGTVSGKQVSSTATYAESWGKLQASRQWRCYICPDHSGEYADIALGDAWYKAPDGVNPGSSLIVVRTERGKRFLESAVSAGVVTLVKEDRTLIDQCQSYLVESRGELWGRLLAMKVAMLRTPAFNGYPTFRFWIKLNTKRKVGSVFGTLKRVFRKKLYASEVRLK